MTPVRIRLLSQQLLSPQYATAAEVVAYMGAMQAQDYRMMRMAVTMRTRRPEKAQLQQAFDRGDIIRMHLLRMTWQLVPRAWALPITRLCHDRNMCALRGWTKSFGFAPSESLLQQSYGRLTGYLQGGHSAPLDTLCAQLTEAGLAATRQQARYLLHYAEIEGILCNGNLTDKDITYALASEKIGAMASPDKDATLAYLARAYFRSHAPATEADFVWWSGLSVTECRRGMQLIEDELTAVELRSPHIRGHRDTYYLHTSTRIRGGANGSTILLPPYDEYLIGYKSRHISLAPEHAHHAHDNKGIFHPVILTNGIVSGSWKQTSKGVEMRYFADQ